MRKNKKKKTGLFWKIASLFFAVCLWYFVIQIQNPNDVYLTSEIEINLQNEKILQDNGLCLYDLEKINLTARLSGRKILLGQSRNYESQIKGIVDFNDYFNGNKIIKEDGEYLPVKVVLPDSLNNYATIEKQSVDLIRVYVDDEISSLRDVTLNVVSTLSNEYVFESEKIKIMPQKIEVRGAKTIVDNVDKVIANINVSSSRESIYDVELIAYDNNKNRITNVTINPSKIQVSIPILMQKSVKFNLNILNNLSEGYELEEVKIEPTEISVADSIERYDMIPNTISIPLSIIEEEGEHIATQSVNLDERLYNVKGISEVKITYKVKKN